MVAAQHYGGYISSFHFSVAITFCAGEVSGVRLPTGRVAKCILHDVAAAAWIGLEDEGAQTRRDRADSNFQGDVCCRCARYGACIVGIEVQGNIGTAGMSQYGDVDEQIGKDSDEHD